MLRDEPTSVSLATKPLLIFKQTWCTRSEPYPKEICAIVYLRKFTQGER